MIHEGAEQSKRWIIPGKCLLVWGAGLNSQDRAQLLEVLDEAGPFGPACLVVGSAQY